MRLVAGVLALTLFAPLANADDARPAEPRPPSGMARGKVPLRVVRVMAESHQALLYDRSRSTHVLAEVGGSVAGYAVESIDDEEVVLSIEGKQIVLVVPSRSTRDRADPAPREAPAVHIRSAAAAQEGDPASSAAPIDPYGEPIRIVQAPGAGAPQRQLEPGDGGVRVVQAPGGASAALAARPIEPGDDGIRVVAAPGRGLPDPRTAPLAPPPAGPAGTGGSTPAATAGAVPGIDAGAGQAPTVGSPAASSPASDLVPVGASPTINPMPIVGSLGPPPAPSAPATPSPAIRDSTPPIAARTAPGFEATAAAAAPARRTAKRSRAAAPPAPRTAAEKQTDDARALADVMSFDVGRARRTPGGTAGASASTAGSATAAPSIAGASTAGSITADAAPAGAAVVAPSPSASPRAASDIRTAPAGSDAVVLARSEVDGALADFARLTLAVQGSFTASGVAIQSVADASIFQRAGLRAGDVISTVNGSPLRSLDDAANLYARASSARAFTAQILRGGKPMTLHVAIR